MRAKVKTEHGTENGEEPAGADASGVSMGVDSGGISVKKEDEGMVFTSTTEFTSRLEVNLVEYDLCLFCLSVCLSMMDVLSRRSVAEVVAVVFAVLGIFAKKFFIMVFFVSLFVFRKIGNVRNKVPRKLLRIFCLPDPRTVSK